MGRPSKLTPDMQHEIISRLTVGATIKATCDAVGISDETFSNWMKRGQAELLRREGKVKSGTPKWNEEQPYIGFFGEATRAQAAGLVTAAGRFREGMNPYDVETESTDTTTETRLRTVKHPNGTVEQVPYEYTKTVRKSSVTHSPGDWRCAKDYLARRDSKNWAETRKQEVTGEDGGPVSVQWVEPKFPEIGIGDDELPPTD